MRALPIFFIALAGLSGCASIASQPAPTAITAPADDRQAMIDLSRQKWGWMAARDMAPLEALFHPTARFVHMGATMNRIQELDVIRGGQIQYKHAEIAEITAEQVGDTVVVYSRLRLTAVVGGNEVINPFSVTEVYIRADSRWQLTAMAFTKLLGE